MRAFVKGAGLFALGWIPGGPTLYRRATRDWLGTQATHVEKLSRVVPGYARLFDSIGFQLKGSRVAILDPGLTTYWPMACWLLTGEQSEHLQLEAHFLPKYVSRSAGGIAESLKEIAPDRLATIESLRWARSPEDVLSACHATEHREVDPSRIPLKDASVDLFHSGGTLEHFEPMKLEELIRDAVRVLVPGGIYSAVHDHRDHLYHADKSMEPMNHLRHAEPVYRLLYGHRLLYHNRIPPMRVAELLKRAGLEQVAMRRMTLPDQKYVTDEEVMRANVGCSRLAARHRSIIELDLRTAACHYLYRKPA